MRASVLGVVLLVGGCDAVFGLSGDPGPCGSTSFATAKGVDITPAEAFSISRDRTLVVLENEGLAYQLVLPGGQPEAIDLGVYPAVSFSIAPEGGSLFYTAMIEPPLLLGAVRSGATWSLDATVPSGTYVGTPSADEFGPRRVIARLRDARSDLQEYEDDGGVWIAHGDTHPTDAQFAPNLAPNGLTMVYAALDPATGLPAVFVATRSSMADWFGAPTSILPGAHSAPQLLDMCRELYVIDDDQTLRRYDRP